MQKYNNLYNYIMQEFVDLTCNLLKWTVKHPSFQLEDIGHRVKFQLTLQLFSHFSPPVLTNK